MGLCRLCRYEQPLVKSHVIPEAFFRELREGDVSPILISNGPNRPPRRAPIGVYDQTILCSTCEGKFQSLDDYGIQILLKDVREKFRPLIRKDAAWAHEGDVDQERVLRFLLAVLWRASVSTHGFYSKVKLGPHEEAAAQLIRQPSSPVPPLFAAIISIWEASSETERMTAIVQDPYPERWEGVLAYRFYLGKVVAYIKVSQLPFRPPLYECSIGMQPFLVAISRNFDTSKDLKLMKKVANQSRLTYLRKTR